MGAPPHALAVTTAAVRHHRCGRTSPPLRIPPPNPPRSCTKARRRRRAFVGGGRSFRQRCRESPRIRGPGRRYRANSSPSHRPRSAPCPTKWISRRSRPSASSRRRWRDALAGLRANEARYFKNKYDHVFTVEPATRKAKKTIDWVHRILEGGARHRHRVAAAGGDRVRGRGHPDGLRVLRERPVDQRDVHPRRTRRSGPSASSCPTAWRSPTSSPSFKFARQKSKLAGTIRGSYFVIKGEY